MSAIISNCKNYRYLLERDISPSGKGTILFIMLNPSTADHSIDDPTIKRCLSFSTNFCMEKLKVINLFAYRSTDPRQLKVVTDPYGPENKKYQEEEIMKADKIVCAWGTKGKMLNAENQMYKLISTLGRTAYALEFTKNRHPKHPLYVRGSCDLIEIPIWEKA